MLQDRIVIGVKDPHLQRKLLETGDLTLQKAVDICRVYEMSQEQCKLIQQ